MALTGAKVHDMEDKVEGGAQEHHHANSTMFCMPFIIIINIIVIIIIIIIVVMVITHNGIGRSVVEGPEPPDPRGGNTR